jgi:hypothetical protein
MPYESVGDFLMRASPQEIKRINDILLSVPKWDGKPTLLHSTEGIPHTGSSPAFQKLLKLKSFHIT